jgi:general secretion pathway protein K
MDPTHVTARTACHRPAVRALARQRGIALVVVLWLTVLLTVIASGFAYSMRGEALAARNTISLAQARAAADGAVERALFEVMRSRGLADAWTANGLPHSWKDGEIDVTTTIVDENARIDLNMAPDPLLKGLLQGVGGLDADTAQHLLDAILDWRDPDDLRRPNGAEAADYRAAGAKYVPSNLRFESVGDLSRVLGMTPALMAKLADGLTVYSRQRGINPQTASREVLLSLPGATADQVDPFLAARADALANKMPIPPFAPATGFAVAPGTVLRITAQARLPDGVTFVRDAVLYPPGDVQQPVTVLLWQEGAPRPRAEAAPADPNAGQK